MASIPPKAGRSHLPGFEWIKAGGSDQCATLLAKNEELVATFDRSVRRGLDLLNREVAVRSTPEINGEGQLMQHIRSFLQFFAA